MKTFKQRIEDYEYFCDKLYLCLKNGNTDRVEEYINKVKTTGLNLSHQKKDYISIYFLNNKKISAVLFFLLLDIKAKMNNFNYSIILSLYKKDIDNNDITLILSYYKDKKKEL